MEFDSQICTTEEQSKRLLALGLKKERIMHIKSFMGFHTYAKIVEL